MKRWYVVQTHLRAEGQAARHLRQQGFDAYLPQYMKRRRHARRVDRVAAPLFPRYAFVRLDLNVDRWRAVNSTLGVARLISNGETPAFVADEVVDEIRRRETNAGMVKLFEPERFKAGDRVTVIEGAFADQVGIFQCLDDTQRVVLLLGLMGRELRLSVPQEAVVAA